MTDLDIDWNNLTPTVANFRLLERLIRRTHGDPAQEVAWTRALVERGRLYAREGDLPEAREDYSAVLAVRSRLSEPEAVYHSARAMVNLGVLGLREGDAGQAIALWKQAVREYSVHDHGLPQKAVFKAWALISAQEKDDALRQKIRAGLREQYSGSRFSEVRKALLDFLLGVETPFEETNQEAVLLTDALEGRLGKSSEAELALLEQAWLALDRPCRRTLLAEAGAGSEVTFRALFVRAAGRRPLYADEEDWLWNKFPADCRQVLPLASLAVRGDAAAEGIKQRLALPMEEWTPATDTKGVRRCLWLDDETVVWLTGAGQLYRRRLDSPAVAAVPVPRQVKDLVQDGPRLWLLYWEAVPELGLWEQGPVQKIGLEAPAEALAFDGKQLLVAQQGRVYRRQEDGFVVLEGVGTGAPLLLLRAKDGALAGADNTGHCFYHAPSDKQSRRWQAHKGTVSVLQFLDRWVLTGGEDQHFRVWEPKRAQTDLVYEANLEAALLDLSVGGGKAVVLSGRQCLVFGPGKSAVRPHLPGTGFQSAVLSPQGKKIVIGDTSGRLTELDLATGHKHTARLHVNWVFCLAWSPDGRHLASGGLEGLLLVRRWDEAVPVLAEGQAEVHGLQWAGDRLVAVQAGVVNFLTAGGQRERGLHRDYVSAWSWDEAGQILATADISGLVRFWTAQGQLLGEWEAGAPVLAWSWGPGGRAACGLADGRLVLGVWKQGRGKAFGFERLTEVKTGCGALHEVYFAAQGWVVCAGATWSCEIYEFEGGHPKAKLDSSHRKALLSTTLRPDGTVVTASEDGQVLLWNWDGLLIDVLRQVKTPLRGLRSQGMTALGREGEKELTVFHLSYNAETENWAGHKALITAAEYLPGGQFVLTGSRDRTLRLWRLPEGKPSQKLAGLEEEIRVLAASPDGRQVAAVGRSGRIGVWNLDKVLALWQPLDWHREQARQAKVEWEHWFQVSGLRDAGEPEEKSP